VLDGHTGLFGRLELHSDVRAGCGARAELEDEKMRGFERGVGRSEILDGLSRLGSDGPESKLATVMRRIARCVGVRQRWGRY
jgi:hypothetical protein